MALTISTGVKKKTYIWSVIGIICFSLGFYLDSEESNTLIFDKFTDLGIQCCSMGLVGLVLTAYSFIKMYFRVGIWPGLYHSTVCIPSMQENNFLFTTNQGFYYAIAAGVSFFLVLWSQVLVLSVSHINSSVALQIQTYLGVFLLLYCYCYSLEKNNEIIGNLFTLICMHLNFFREKLEVNAVSLFSGAMLLLLSMALIFFKKKEQKTLDFHSVSIIILAIQGIAGIIITISVLLLDKNALTWINACKGVVYSIAAYLLVKCEDIELVFLFTYPSIVNIITHQIDTLAIITIVLIGIGLLIIWFGDLPFKSCSKFQKTKSPLHSPLL